MKRTPWKLLLSILLGISSGCTVISPEAEHTHHCADIGPPTFSKCCRAREKGECVLWGPTGDGFSCDAYGGTADIVFAHSQAAAEAWLSEDAKRLPRATVELAKERA